MKKIVEKIQQIRGLLISRISNLKILWQKRSIDIQCLKTKIRDCSTRLLAVMTHKKNLGRDVIIISLVILFLIILFFGNNLFFYIMEKRSERFLSKIEKQEVVFSQDQVYEEVKAIQDTIDKAGWKNHQSQWYGFEVKYPGKWKNPINQAASRNSKWEYRYQFRKNEINENTPYVGFDLAIYSLTKIGSLANTDDFPSFKDENLKNSGSCENISGHIIETGDYPAEEIYVPQTDDCYAPALFFSYTKGDYVYNLVPVVRDGIFGSGDPRIEIVDNFPEFFGIISTIRPIDIVRPKPRVAEVKPQEIRPKAPMPVAFRRVNNRLVCDKENDKPGKSNKGKGKHLDMECCLDPDEYPNPNCYYDPGKYGKYL